MSKKHAWSLSCVQLFASPWILQSIRLQGILQATILEWVAISFSGDLPDPGIKSHLCLLHFKKILYLLSHQGSPLRSNDHWKISIAIRDPISKLKYFMHGSSKINSTSTLLLPLHPPYIFQVLKLFSNRTSKPTLGTLFQHQEQI